jgi:hypothetical protein
VWGVELIDIPYYNSEPGHDKAIEFYVRLPQGMHDEMYKYLKNFKYENVKDSLIYRGYFDKKYKDAPYNVDVLGLKSTYFGEPEY